MKSIVLLSLLVAVAALLVATTDATQFPFMATLGTNMHNLRLNVTNGKTVYTVDSEDEADGAIVATAMYNQTYLATGWDYLVMMASEELMADAAKHRDAYFNVGYLEGYLTGESIFNMFNNVVKDKKAPLTKEANTWIDEHLAYMEGESDKGGAFATMIGNILSQIDGLRAGYNIMKNNNDTTAGSYLTFRDMFLISFRAELGDVTTATSAALDSTIDQDILDRFPNLGGSQKDSTTAPYQPNHCSALIKNTGDDLIVAHATWEAFNSMLRQYKTYKFGRNEVVMSSYPGTVHSTDDFYMTAHKLVATETTFSMFNKALTREFVKPQTVSEFIRVMIANYLGTTGPDWIQWFSQQNSGTYCNQWMIVDMKLFTPGQPVPDNTLWVAEQLPGDITSDDVSKFLQNATGNETFWPSYNFPYFKNVYNKSGYLAQYDKFGSFFGYDTYARAKIFHRDAPKTESIADVQKFIRSCDWKTDEFSTIPNCDGTTDEASCLKMRSPMLCIAARGDLDKLPYLPTPEKNRQTYGPIYKYLLQQNLGAIDGKVTSHSNMVGEQLIALVQSGPTTENGNPIFDWNRVPPLPFVNVPHKGLSATYDPAKFVFEEYALPEQATIGPSPQPEESNNSGKTVAIVLGVIGGILVLTVIGYVVKTKVLGGAEDADYQKV